ncbi:DUF3606 domain-containing protein [Hymenobacter arizonensis]|uniref:DUF3606 domain-containing protein n=1 Tax=Hymenobacter arizonensis TaxID=1227077 RepID=A0A1I6BFV5_HYMAR|nr:Protein of unknown function [Hymenobacter arizonensis]
MLNPSSHNARREGNYICLDDDEAVLEWCEALGCTPKRLRQAVLAVGPALADVYRYLQSQKA